MKSWNKKYRGQVLRFQETSDSDDVLGWLISTIPVHGWEKHKDGWQCCCESEDDIFEQAKIWEWAVYQNETLFETTLKMAGFELDRGQK